MCGIGGLYHFKNSRAVHEAELVKMQDTLIHRGPDDAGIYISPDKKIGLANRRLKIIDLSAAAKMPMTFGKKDVWITYNGEIYNFRELRRELQKKGYEFKTKSDTEVILASYLEYGPDCVNYLNGMFAFVIWDGSKTRLFAARDHMGVKPFYYSIQNGTFFFGSEIKAILAHPDFKKELNETGIYHYLTFGSTPAPHTLFKNIQKLPAAHYLLVNENGTVIQKQYWDPVATTIPRNETFYVEEIRTLLKDSIRSQMVSDVPFGCFLSGGIDSSLNATLMSEALGKPVETFSVGYRDFEEKNEFTYSRAIAKKLGAKTHEILLDESHLREFLEKYPFYADDPVSDQVCFPLFWLSKLTRDNGVIVIQIGEGSDEIFAGYDTYIKILKLREKWNWLRKITPGLMPAFSKTAEVLWHTLKKSDAGKEYLQRLALKQEPFWGLAIAFGNHAKQNLLSREFNDRMHESSYDIVENYYRAIKKEESNADYLKQMTYLEIKQRLPEFLLARADKMTMAHSVEGRVPFLDKRLVELALNMPMSEKIKGNEPKHILKRAVQEIIPDNIIRRKKQGFSNPIGEWLKPEKATAKELTDVVLNSKLRERNLLNYGYIKELIDSHQRQGMDQNFKIWTLITLSLWYNYWFK